MSDFNSDNHVLSESSHPGRAATRDENKHESFLYSGNTKTGLRKVPRKRPLMQSFLSVRYELELIRTAAKVYRGKSLFLTGS